MGVKVTAVFAALVALSGATAAVTSADPSTPTPTPGTDHGAPGPAAPATVIDRDGTFTVGRDIAPGVYSSPGPWPDEACYWRRIGTNGATADNAMSKQPQVVAIDAGDLAFKTNGCQPWQLTPGATPPNQAPPWLSQLQLRHDLDILNGLIAQSGAGQLPPY